MQGQGQGQHARQHQGQQGARVTRVDGRQRRLFAHPYLHRELGRANAHLLKGIDAGNAVHPRVFKHPPLATLHGQYAPLYQRVGFAHPLLVFRVPCQYQAVRVQHHGHRLRRQRKVLHEAGQPRQIQAQCSNPGGRARGIRRGRAEHQQVAFCDAPVHVAIGPELPCFHGVLEPVTVFVMGRRGGVEGLGRAAQHPLSVGQGQAADVGELGFGGTQGLVTGVAGGARPQPGALAEHAHHALDVGELLAQLGRAGRHLALRDLGGLAPLVFPGCQQGPAMQCQRNTPQRTQQQQQACAQAPKLRSGAGNAKGGARPHGPIPPQGAGVGQAPGTRRAVLTAAAAPDSARCGWPHSPPAARVCPPPPRCRHPRRLPGPCR